MGCLNCFFEIRDAGITNGETFYINSRENFVLVAVALSIVSIAYGWLVGVACEISRMGRDQSRQFFGAAGRDFINRLVGF